jgi:hypothetical protein
MLETQYTSPHSEETLQKIKTYLNDAEQELEKIRKMRGELPFDFTYAYGFLPELIAVLKFNLCMKGPVKNLFVDDKYAKSKEHTLLNNLPYVENLFIAGRSCNEKNIINLPFSLRSVHIATGFDSKKNVYIDADEMHLKKRGWNIKLPFDCELVVHYQEWFTKKHMPKLNEPLFGYISYKDINLFCKTNYINYTSCSSEHMLENLCEVLRRQDF